MNFQEILFSAIGTILTGLLVWLVSIVTNWINSKIKDKNAAKILTSITTLATNAVQATYQSYVEALKDKDAFTAEAQKEAFNKTYNAVLAILSDDAKEYLTNAFGDLEAYIKSKIEAEVNMNK